MHTRKRKKPQPVKPKQSSIAQALQHGRAVGDFVRDVDDVMTKFRKSIVGKSKEEIKDLKKAKKDEILQRIDTLIEALGVEGLKSMDNIMRIAEVNEATRAMLKQITQQAGQQDNVDGGGAQEQKAGDGGNQDQKAKEIMKHVLESLIGMAQSSDDLSTACLTLDQTLDQIVDNERAQIGCGMELAGMVATVLQHAAGLVVTSTTFIAACATLESLGAAVMTPAGLAYSVSGVPILSGLINTIASTSYFPIIMSITKTVIPDIAAQLNPLMAYSAAAFIAYAAGKTFKDTPIKDTALQAIGFAVSGISGSKVGKLIADLPGVISKSPKRALGTAFGIITGVQHKDSGRAKVAGDIGANLGSTIEDMPLSTLGIIIGAITGGIVAGPGATMIAGTAAGYAIGAMAKGPAQAAVVATVTAVKKLKKFIGKSHQQQDAQRQEVKSFANELSDQVNKFCEIVLEAQLNKGRGRS